MTLIELILVMGILAFIAAITAPRLSGFAEGRKYVGEWNRLTAMLRYARSEAISRATHVEVQFHADRGSYGIVDEAAMGFQPITQGNPPKTDDEAGEHVLPKKLTFEFPEAVPRNGDDDQKGTTAHTERPQGVVSIMFCPDGSVDEDSPKMVRLFETKGGFSRALEQDPVLGYVAHKEIRP